MPNTQIDRSIFKAYDIRGIYPGQLDEDAAYQIARAYATLLISENPDKPLTVGVGSDMRLSSPSLKAKVIEGLMDSGVNVEHLGLVSTPTFYFAVARNGYDGGLQVSASHNPKEWNGLKMVRRNAVPVSGDTGIQAIRELIEKSDLPPAAEARGKLTERDGSVEDEVEAVLLLAETASIKPFRIVIDGANSMGSEDMLALFKKIPATLVPMNFELDGNFPAHEADPMKPENTQALCDRVVAEKADLGIAPDGDGDRYFFVTEQGRVLPQAILRGLMAQIELKEHPGAKVAYDIRPGRITRDMIEEFGGQAIVTPVGHSLIKEIMIREDAIFGGESSGHYFYKLPFGTFECPMLLVIKLLKYLSEQGKPFSEVMKPFMRYAHSGEINTKVGTRQEAMSKIEAVKAKYKDGRQIFVDGVTIEYPDYWFNLRTSNTEPVIRLTVEARSQDLMQEKTKELLDLIRA
ncbi:MAG: phosphomannomutase/phosphoglucomutase [Candidatus Saccharibacteria bacterium]